jgi:large subunit ribosomal protein L2
MTTLVNPDLDRENEPLKGLTRGKKSRAGRNNSGRTTVRFRGGGHKRKDRLVDFKRDKHGVPGKIAKLEYDPCRSANLALVHYIDGDKRYIIAPQGLQVGQEIIAGPDSPVVVGNSLPLRKLPLGSLVHNIELSPGRGGKVARGAGMSAQLLAKEGGWAQLKMPSGEIRKFNLDCYATVGEVGNFEHENIDIGKAGRKRWLGRRPHTRGTVMNPVDHPHGGGEGKSNSGRPPSSPWGTQAKGFKTRKKRNPTSSLIVRRRQKGR